MARIEYDNALLSRIRTDKVFSDNATEDEDAEVKQEPVKKLTAEEASTDKPVCPYAHY